MSQSFKNLINQEDVAASLATGINSLQNICHGLAVEGGWWEPKGEAAEAQKMLTDGTELTDEMRTLLTKVATKERNPLELLALCHSELSEALEGVRKDQMDDHLTHRKMEEVELADTIVRILDYAGGRNLDVGGALVEKLAYNTQRADHKPENRAKADGKKY